MRLWRAGQVQPQQAFEQPAVIRHLQVQQLVDNDVILKTARLPEQPHAEADPTARGTRCPFAPHALQAGGFRFHAEFPTQAATRTLKRALPLRPRYAA